MSANTKSFNNDSEVHISYEDQQMINKFAKLNAKYEDYKKRVSLRQNELQNIEDAVNELMLADDDERIMFAEGEIFLHKSVTSAQNSLEEYKNGLLTITKDDEKELVSLKEQMDTLKAHLYAKFGSNIHLEMED